MTVLILSDDCISEKNSLSSNSDSDDENLADQIEKMKSSQLIA